MKANKEITWVGIKSSDLMVLMMHLSKVGEFSVRKEDGSFILFADSLTFTHDQIYIKLKISEIQNFVKYFPDFGIKTVEFEDYVTIRR